MAGNIRTVAREAGVSPTTVSRVFSGSGYVSQAVRERVLAEAQRQDFQPKPYRKQNRSLFCSAVGVVIPDIRNTYYMEVIHGVEEILNPIGMDVLICNTDEEPGKEAHCLSTLHQAGVGGIIVVPVSNAEQYNSERLITLNRARIPVVLLDRDIPGEDLDGVFMDNFNSAYQSVRVLAENGHTHIAIIAGPKTSTSGSARLEGYLAALRDFKIPIRREYILHGDFKPDLAYELTRQLLARRLPVTAIFSSNSRMSRGCLAALMEQGIKIPGEMAFISCGRLDGNFDSITTVEYPTRQIGWECANILLERMRGSRKNKGPKKRITFGMELRLRGSERFTQSSRGQNNTTK